MLKNAGLLTENKTIYLWGLGLHSAGIIAYQLALIHLISIMQWHHFAFMIISIAMLGFGASGTVLALFKNQILRHSAWIIPVLTAITGLLMILVFHISTQPSLQFDLYLLFVDLRQFKTLAITLLLFFLPFFTGAMVIGIYFVKNANQIGKYYFSNLLGSGIGGIAAIILISYLYPLKILPFVSFMHIIASILLGNRHHKFKVQASATILSAATTIFLAFSASGIPLSEYKDISKALTLPDAKVIYTEPDIGGLIEVVESPVMRYAPALSLSFRGTVPIKKKVFLNGNFYGAIPIFDPELTDIHDFTTKALPFVMGPRDNVLVLNAKTGTSIAHSIQRGAINVTGIVEIRGVKDLMMNEFAQESGNLYHHEKSNIIYQDSRQYLMKPNNKLYDAIILPMQESFGGSKGLQSIEENYIMTIEAFDRMWDLLSPTGVIVITTWLDHPPRTVLKIAATIGELLRENGILEPTHHIAAIRSWGTITFAVKKSPVTPEEATAIRQFCYKKLFDPLLLPDIREYERERFNYLESRQVIDFIDQLIGNTPSKLTDKYQFYINPATDDKPYFHRFLKIAGLPHLLSGKGIENIHLFELGYLIVWITLIKSSILGLILIILPLFRLRRLSRRKPGTLIYFGAIGLGYMFVEIILIQRFILYFGHPVYAVSAVLSTMLIASGAGSLVSGKYTNALKVSGISTIIIAAILLAYSLLLTYVLTQTLQLSLAFKIPIALFLIAIPAFFMGMPFPSGIRLLNSNDPNNIPWAWGINGCLSVVATSLATIIAVGNGFSVVLIISAILYFLAFMVFYGKTFFAANK